MKNIKESIIIGLLVIVIIMNFNLSSKLKQSQSNYQNLYNQINQIQNNISHTNAKINNLANSKKLIQNYDVKIENINNEYKKARITVDLSFNSIRKNSKVYFEYRYVVRNDYEYDYGQTIKEDTQYGEWNEIELQELPSGNFIGSFELDYKYNYETKILVDTGDEIITETLYGLDLFEKSKPQYDLEVSPHTISSKDGFNYNVRFNYSVSLILLENKQDLEIKSAYCKVYNNDKIIDEFELIAEENLESNNPEFSRYFTSKTNELKSSEKSNTNLKIVTEVKDNIGRKFIHVWDDNY